MRIRLRAVLYFLLTIGAVVLTLKVLSWLPLVLQRETLRSYASIEEVRSKLDIRDIRVPSYFPQTITWPPDRVLAQSKPYPAVLMVFHQTRNREPGLVVAQAASDSFSSGGFIDFTHVSEKVPYQLRGRQAQLEVGSCNTEEPCSRLTWTEGSSKITVLMKSPPFEVIRLAESMLR